MNTKIDGVSPGQVSQSIGQARENVTRDGGRNDAPQTTSDETRVDLTSNAVRLGRLDQALASAPDIDVDRVESIKSAIADGSYQVDTDRIAAALLKLDDDINPLG